MSISVAVEHFPGLEGYEPANSMSFEIARKSSRLSGFPTTLKWEARMVSLTSAYFPSATRSVTWNIARKGEDTVPLTYELARAWFTKGKKNDLAGRGSPVVNRRSEVVNRRSEVH